MKFMTTRCRMRWEKRKSAKARSGEMCENWSLFWGLTWMRSDTAMRGV